MGAADPEWTEGPRGEVAGLERATLWSASAVEERLRDHVAGEDNRWLEELSIDLHRVPEDQLR